MIIYFVNILKIKHVRKKGDNMNIGIQRTYGLFPDEFFKNNRNLIKEIEEFIKKDNLGKRILFAGRMCLNAQHVKRLKDIEDHYLNSEHASSEYETTYICVFQNKLSLISLRLEDTRNDRELIFSDIFADGADTNEHDRALLSEKIHIHEDDDFLMHHAKMILKRLNLTNGQFKRLYLYRISNAKIADVHNFLHRIQSTKNHTLSMSKFEIILKMIEKQDNFVTILDNFMVSALGKARKVRAIAEKEKSF